MKNVFLSAFRPLLIALALALGLISALPGSASAQSPSDYYDFSYNVQFSKSQVTGSETFTATVTAEVTCIKDFPLSASRANITGRIVAENLVGGARITLNSGYILTVTPFPAKKDDTTSVEVTVPLQFPAGSATGNYAVITELLNAEVIVIIPINVTSFLASEQAVGTVSYTAAAGGGVIGGGGGLAPSKVSVDGLTANNYLMVNNLGIVQDSIRLQVTGASAFLDIPEGTKVLDAAGDALSSLTALVENNPPALAPGKALVEAIDFGPDGATFAPAITLAMDFNPPSLPEGIALEGLYIASWNGSQWQALPSTLDIGLNRVAARVSHFTLFAIMGSIPVEGAPTEESSAAITTTLPSEPPLFGVSALSLTPAQVIVSQTLIVSATVTNSGGSRGSYTVLLKLNGNVEEERLLILDAGAEYTVSFEVIPQAVGTYEVDVNGLAASFSVTETAPEIAAAAEPAVVAEPLAETPLQPTRPWVFNWWFIGGTAAVLVLVTGWVIYLVWQRRY